MCVVQHRETPHKQYATSVCVQMSACGCEGRGGSGTLYNLFHFFPPVFTICSSNTESGPGAKAPRWFDYNKHKQTHTCNLSNRRRVCVSLRFPPIQLTMQRYFYRISSGTRCATDQAKLLQGGCIFSGSFQSYCLVT